MKPFLIMVALNFVSYLLLVINFRAVAQGRYIESILSDTLIATLGFTIIKRISTANKISERIGFILGGAIASGLGIYLTKTIWGQ